MASANSKANTAKTLNIVGVILGVFMWIAIALYLVIFFVFLGSMLSSFSNLAEDMNSLSSMDFDDMASPGNATDVVDDALGDLISGF